MSPISYTKSNTRSAHKDSPVSEMVLPSFLGTKSLHHRSRLRKRLFGWQQPLKGQASSLPSLVQSQTPDQCIKTVQFPKQFYLLFGDQVFTSQIKTKEEIVWVTLISERASFKSPISCTKSNTRSAHKDSPVSEIISFFSRDQVFATHLMQKKIGTLICQKS